MFERFTERARRVIFFARYETSQFGSLTIETEHLLLGLAREDCYLLQRFLPGLDLENLRERVSHQVEVREKVSTSVDLPMSEECKRILKQSIVEAETLKHNFVSTGHLLLGILSETSCGAARLLRELGLEPGTVRDAVAQMVPTPAGLPQSSFFQIPRVTLPDAGVVPDAETAKRIAQAVWEAQLAELSGESMAPLNAVLMHGVWLVTGTQSGENPPVVHSAFIQKDDGRILRIHREPQPS